MENTELQNDIEINEDSTYKKGIDLEKKFAEYIKSEMKYDKIKIRFQVKQANNSRGANVDVIGQRKNETGETWEGMGIIWLIICFIALVVGFIMEFTNDWGSDLGLYLIICGFILEIVGIIALVISNAYNIDNIWVECKNLKSKVNISQINKMLTEIKQYKASGDSQYKFKEYAFVSASGFIDNAIELAEANSIKRLHLSLGYNTPNEVFKKGA